jgi:hypothetical protein
MRRLFADFAYSRAHRALRRAEKALTSASRARSLRRSRWWSDVESWLSGLGTWRELRDSRERRARQQLPFVAMPLVEGPL